MAKKRYHPEEIISKLREEDILIGRGHALAQGIKSIGQRSQVLLTCPLI
jgi:hypothetical protein